MTENIINDRLQHRLNRHQHVKTAMAYIASTDKTSDARTKTQEAQSTTLKIPQPSKREDLAGHGEEDLIRNIGEISEAFFPYQKGNEIDVTSSS